MGCLPLNLDYPKIDRTCLLVPALTGRFELVPTSLNNRGCMYLKFSNSRK